MKSRRLPGSSDVPSQIPKGRILSGMRPTGKLHLGHLAGALNNWVALQKDFECFFMVADWHALMSEYRNSRCIQEYILDNTLDWISAGIDPEKSTLFVQSDIKEHLDLFMIFSCITPLGWLERNPTYKEQLKELKAKEVNTFGFLGYPVLQAADILIYRADTVPVGEDQLPHLELTREIVRRFNHLYNTDFFPEPKALLTKTPRLLGIDGRKMSKSFNNTINLSDGAHIVREKVQSMFTDPRRIRLSDPGYPQECNVFSYYAVFNPKMKDDVYNWCTNAKAGCTECKKRLAECLLELLRPFQKRREGFSRSKVKKILQDGAQRARQEAAKTLKVIKRMMGI